MSMRRIRLWKTFSIFILIISVLLLPLYPCNVQETESAGTPNIPFSKEKNYLEFHPFLLVLSYHYSWKEDTCSTDWGINWKHEANPIFSIIIAIILIVIVLIIVNIKAIGNYLKIRNLKLKKGKLVFFSICIFGILFLINSFTLLIYYYPHFLIGVHGDERYLPNGELQYLPFLIIIISIIIGILILTILSWALMGHRPSIKPPLASLVCLLIGVSILGGFVFRSYPSLKTEDALVVLLGHGTTILGILLTSLFVGRIVCQILEIKLPFVKDRYGSIVSGLLYLFTLFFLYSNPSRALVLWLIFVVVIMIIGAFLAFYTTNIFLRTKNKRVGIVFYLFISVFMIFSPIIIYPIIQCLFWWPYGFYFMKPGANLFYSIILGLIPLSIGSLTSLEKWKKSR